MQARQSAQYSELAPKQTTTLVQTDAPWEFFSDTKAWVTNFFKSIGNGIYDACYNYGKKTAGYIVDENQTLLDMTNAASKSVTLPAIEFPNTVGAYCFDKIKSAGQGVYNGAVSAASGALSGIGSVVNSTVSALGKSASKMADRGDKIAEDGYDIWHKANLGLEKSADRCGKSISKTASNLEKNAVNKAKDGVKSATGGK